MGPWNVTLARHLEQVRLREEYLRQQQKERRSRPTAMASADGLGAVVVATVRLAPRPELEPS